MVLRDGAEMDGMIGADLGGVFSIREFCELDLPILLFDKDGSFQVVRLEQVCFLVSSWCSTDNDLGMHCSFFRCLSGQSISLYLYETSLRLL